MEQDDCIYEYRLGGEVFRFEAHGKEAAEGWKRYAVLHFQEQLGPRFAEKDILGPVAVHLVRDRSGLHTEGTGHLNAPNSGGITE
jgi:hypothetical protein